MQFEDPIESESNSEIETLTIDVSEEFELIQEKMKKDMMFIPILFSFGAIVGPLFFMIAYFFKTGRLLSLKPLFPTWGIVIILIPLAWITVRFKFKQVVGKLDVIRSDCLLEFTKSGIYIPAVLLNSDDDFINPTSPLPPKSLEIKGINFPWEKIKKVRSDLGKWLVIEYFIDRKTTQVLWVNPRSFDDIQVVKFFKNYFPEKFAIFDSSFTWKLQKNIFNE